MKRPELHMLMARMQLANALSQNCGAKMHRELASRSFTDAVLRLANDRVIFPRPGTAARGLMLTVSRIPISKSRLKYWNG